MRFNWQGHRGCRGLFPENTIAAMIAAIDFGVTTLEMDVVITHDLEVILSHEPYFNHLISTKPDGSPVSFSEETNLNIYQMNYRDIVQYDVGTRPHPEFPFQQKIKAVKPRLNDVIDEVERYTASKALPGQQYNIEIKSHETADQIFHPMPARFVELVMNVISTKCIGGRTNIQSFDKRILQYLRRQYPEITQALLVEDSLSPEEHIKALGFTPAIYSPDYLLLNREVIGRCKKMGMEVIPWTVNDVVKMKELIDWGVDGIITDYPNRIFNI